MVDAPHHRVVIAGAGFSGLGLAIRLREAGIEDFVVLERAHDVGGTWQANTYPGCQCDIPSHLYSFSFAPNPSWSRTYSLGPEIWDYLRRVCAEHSLAPHLRLGHELTAARWEDGEQRWRITTSRGELTASVLVDATGALSHPRRPRLPGLRGFEGTIFHSARWDHDHDLAGERVAVIGTGASAIQFVPEIAPIAGTLHVFQRTAPWVLPHSDRRIRPAEQRLYRALPLAQRGVRALVYVLREAVAFGMTRDPRALRALERVARRHLHRQVHDPELRAKLEPDFRIGCKRMLLSNRYYPALTRANVELVTDAIAEIRPHSIVTADGREREVDTIVLGTGFRVTDPPTAAIVRGRDGRTLAQRKIAGDGIESYLGTAFVGYPNLFRMTGPNTGLGHNSMIYMIESQIAYVADALRVMDERGVASAELRPEVAARYNARIQARMPRTVWASGCSSWYLDASGTNVVLWPDYTFRYRRRLRRFDARAYALRAAAVQAGADRVDPRRYEEPAPPRAGAHSRRSRSLARPPGGGPSRDSR